MFDDGRPAPVDEPDDAMSAAERDEYENELIASGGVLMALLMSGAPALREVKAVTDRRGRASNQIDVRLSFMVSPYRLTITRTEEVEEVF